MLTGKRRGPARRRYPTSTDTKCPQYSDQTVAATVALGQAAIPAQIHDSGCQNSLACSITVERATILGISGPCRRPNQTRPPRGPTERGRTRKCGQNFGSPAIGRLRKASALWHAATLAAHRKMIVPELPSADKGADILGISLGI